MKEGGERGAFRCAPRGAREEHASRMTSGEGGHAATPERGVSAYERLRTHASSVEAHTPPKTRLLPMRALLIPRAKNLRIEAATVFKIIVTFVVGVVLAFTLTMITLDVVNQYGWFIGLFILLLLLAAFWDMTGGRH